MAFYSVSTISLSKRNENDSSSSKKVFYADDGLGAGKLDGLDEWFRTLKVNGKPLGYDVNDKTWMLVKPEHAERAREIFPTIKMTTEGRPYLGS